MRVNKLNSNKYQKQWKSLSFFLKKKWKGIASKNSNKIGRFKWKNKEITSK